LFQSTFVVADRGLHIFISPGAQNGEFGLVISENEAPVIIPKVMTT
jgi:hypothetical protein